MFPTHTFPCLSRADHPPPCRLVYVQNVVCRIVNFAAYNSSRTKMLPDCAVWALDTSSVHSRCTEIVHSSCSYLQLFCVAFICTRPVRLPHA